MLLDTYFRYINIILRRERVSIFNKRKTLTVSKENTIKETFIFLPSRIISDGFLSLYLSLIFYPSVIVRRDLCHLAFLLNLVGRTARAVHMGGRWEDIVEFPSDVRKDVKDALKLIVKNEWIKPKTAFEPQCDIWSDASDTHWAFPIFAQDVLVGAKRLLVFFFCFVP